MSDEDYNLTLEEAAQILGFTKGTVWRYTKEGKLSKIYVKDRGKRLIKVKEEEVRKLAADKKRKTGAKEPSSPKIRQKSEENREISEFLVKRYERAIYKIGQLEERLTKLEKERKKLIKIRTEARQWLDKRIQLEMENKNLEYALRSEREKTEDFKQKTGLVKERISELGEKNKILSDDLELEKERRAKLEAENQNLDLELKKERSKREKLEGDLEILKGQIEKLYNLADIKFTEFIKAKLGRIIRRKRRKSNI